VQVSVPPAPTSTTTLGPFRELGVQVERTTYPPGFSLKRRGVTPERMLQAVVDLLYACG
jgi:hypothetical protein